MPLDARGHRRILDIPVIFFQAHGTRVWLMCLENNPVYSRTLSGSACVPFANQKSRFRRFSSAPHSSESKCSGGHCAFQFANARKPRAGAGAGQSLWGERISVSSTRRGAGNHHNHRLMRQGNRTRFPEEPRVRFPLRDPIGSLDFWSLDGNAAKALRGISIQSKTLARPT
jgi:hypothetical protein